jgi:HAMP domain-containing protein
VAALVGTEGTLGVQADVKDVSGIWKELTDNVNLMGRNLTDQVRDIAAVTTAVANGDLSKKITVDVKGEILQLKNTINNMVETLSVVLGRGHAHGARGRHRGRAGRPGGRARRLGVWLELTQNVNSMANNLTTQVRNIAEVARAGRHGDLSRQDHRRRPGRGAGAEEHPERHGGPAERLRRRGDPGVTRGRGSRAAWAGRPRCWACAACGRSSPTTSTTWRPT